MDKRLHSASAWAQKIYDRSKRVQQNRASRVKLHLNALDQPIIEGKMILHPRREKYQALALKVVLKGNMPLSYKFKAELPDSKYS
mmetsp:Transcript_24002/g.45612  ORF Transcript_24002/g.45612 Transcript_24002/m.45612 type:complete len:85 (-) Transcript_24002:946-1200(-)